MNSPDRNAVRQEVPVDEHGKPIINTVAAVAIAPSGVGADHLGALFLWFLVNLNGAGL